MAVSKKEIITEALELCEVLGEGEEPNLDMEESCGRTLDYLIKAWQTEGIHIWAVTDLEVPITTGTKEYTIGPGEDIDVSYRPIRITTGVHRDIDGNDIPVNIWSREEYWRLSDKGTEGLPLNVYYHREKERGTLYVWQTGNSNSDKLILQVQKSLDITDEDDIDFPDEYFLALSYWLAFTIAPKYGVSRTKIGTLADQATVYKSDAEGYDREDVSLYLEPDPYSLSYWGR